MLINLAKARYYATDAYCVLAVINCCLFLCSLIWLRGPCGPLAGDDGGVAPARYQVFIPLYGEAVKCNYLEDAGSSHEDRSIVNCMVWS